MLVTAESSDCFEYVSHDKTGFPVAEAAWC